MDKMASLQKCRIPLYCSHHTFFFSIKISLFSNFASQSEICFCWAVTSHDQLAVSFKQCRMPLLINYSVQIIKWQTNYFFAHFIYHSSDQLHPHTLLENPTNARIWVKNEIIKNPSLWPFDVNSFFKQCDVVQRFCEIVVANKFFIYLVL